MLAYYGGGALWHSFIRHARGDRAVVSGVLFVLSAWCFARAAVFDSERAWLTAAAAYVLTSLSSP